MKSHDPSAVNPSDPRIMEIRRSASAAAERHRFREANAMVYFIEAAAVGLIKVGHAIDPLARLRNMLCDSPVPLRLAAVMPGGHKRELEIHQQLIAHHSHGEWFRRCEALDEIMSGASLTGLPEMFTIPPNIGRGKYGIPAPRRYAR